MYWLDSIVKKAKEEGLLPYVGPAEALPLPYRHQRKKENARIRDLTHPNPPFPEAEGREKDGLPIYFWGFGKYYSGKKNLRKNPA